MQEKVKNDVRKVIMDVRQGYLDHILLCERLMTDVGGIATVMGDGLLPPESKQSHLQYVNEIDELLRTIGVNPTNEFIQPPSPPVVLGTPSEVSDTTLVQDLPTEIPDIGFKEIEGIITDNPPSN